MIGLRPPVPGHRRLEVLGWEAEVMDPEGYPSLGIQRVRFTKAGYQSMDMAMTEVFLAVADEAEVIGMMAAKLGRHQLDQDMKRPPGPGYTFDGDQGHQGFFTKPVKITADEVGIKYTASDLLILDDLPDTRSKRQIMEDGVFPKETRPEVLSPSEQGKVDLSIKEVHGTVELTNKVTPSIFKTTEMLMREAMRPRTSYAAIMSPIVLKDLYGEVTNHTDYGPDAEETGEWEI